MIIVCIASAMKISQVNLQNNAILDDNSCAIPCADWPEHHLRFIKHCLPQYWSIIRTIADATAHQKHTTDIAVEAT
jgi:hypothetical protein